MCGKINPNAAAAAYSAMPRMRRMTLAASYSSGSRFLSGARSFSTMTTSSTAHMRKRQPTKNPIRLSNAAQPMSSVITMAAALSATELHVPIEAAFLCRAGAIGGSPSGSLRGGSGGVLARSPRTISSHVTPYSSARRGSMERSGELAPVSQLETVLFDTPSLSATSCWV